MAIYSILDSQVVIIAFKFVFLDLYIERSKFIFSGLRPGLTNRVPVRDSVSRTPLLGSGIQCHGSDLEYGALAPIQMNFLPFLIHIVPSSCVVVNIQEDCIEYSTN